MNCVASARTAFFVHPFAIVPKTFPSYVGSSAPIVAQFLAHLAPRQIAVAAAYLDGLTQCEIADQQHVDQKTVSRDLDLVRKVCRRFDRELPKPLRVRAADEIQLSDDLYKTL